MLTAPKSSIRLCNLWIRLVISSIDISIGAISFVLTPDSVNSLRVSSNWGSNSRLRALNDSICSAIFSISEAFKLRWVSISTKSLLISSLCLRSSPNLSVISLICTLRTSSCSFNPLISSVNLALSSSKSLLVFRERAIVSLCVLIVVVKKSICWCKPSISFWAFAIFLS